MHRIFQWKVSLVFVIALLTTGQYLGAQIAAPSPYSFSVSPNRVRTIESLAPIADSAALASSGLRAARVNSIYYDGLGRMLQTVGKQASLATNPYNLSSSSEAKDMVHAAVHDPLGRSAVQYLPFVANTSNGNTSVTDGAFKNNPFQQQQSFMQQQYGSQGETYFYVLQKYDGSPLNQVVETFAPGNNWVGTEGNSNPSQRRSIKTARFINTAVDSVRIWQVTDSLEKFGGYSSNSFYSPGSLYKTVIADEQGVQTVEYKDKSGKVVLTKTQNGSISDDGSGKGHTGWKCTYYIYDKFEKLRAVIQPLGVTSLMSNGWAVSAAILDGFFFRYEYDSEGRLIMERVPSAAPSRMVYDARGRLVMYQNAFLATAGKWKVVLYDNQDRVVRTGLLANTYNNKTFSQHLQTAVDSLGYPFTATSLPSSAYWETLTILGYDDYTTMPGASGLSSQLDVTYTNGNYVDQSFNLAPEYSRPCVQAAQVKGALTWKQVKVLGANPEQFITSVFIYDRDGRALQTQTSNITGGVDIATTQYSWNGNVIRAISKTEKAGVNPETLITVTKLTYDDLWRVVKTEVRTSHSNISAGALSPWTVVSTMIYDALGQVVTKNIGNKRPSSDGSQPLQKTDAEYNIRGWLIASNKEYVQGNTSLDRYFGFETSFDKNSSLGSSTAQFTGSVASVLWKSEGGQDRRRFSYSYDVSGQLTSSTFGQYVSGSGSSAVFNTSSGLDFTTSGLSYDLNGNILSLNQKGWKPGGSQTIDSLLYSYHTTSNKLKNVLDRTNDTASILGDFRSSGIYMNSLGGTKATSSTDYVYNDAGMVLKDLNKNIGSSSSNGIIYNFLSLQDKVAVFSSGGVETGSIEYVYDAEGSKLKKVIKESGKADQVYLYGAGAIYLNDVLQFASQAEGRIRYTPGYTTIFETIPPKLDYDYMLKDHLGNVRVVLTEELQQDNYTTLSFEGSGIPAEPLNAQNAVWENKSGQSINVTSVRTTRPGSFGTRTSNGSYVLLVRKSTGSIGATKLLRVMSGDRLHTSVEYYYEPTNSNNTGADGISSLVANLGTALSNAGSVGSLLKANTSSVVSPLALTSSLISLLNTPAQQSGSNLAPKAYLNILFFDEQFKFDAEASFVLPLGYSPGIKGTLSKLAANAAVAKRNGYAYVYISNESDEMVYFDNFTMSHERGPILEETHYYPFGLPISAISGKAAGKMANRFKGNMGSELNTELSMQLYETANRSYDPQIGRFHVPDPLAKDYVSFSPYNYGFNDPIYWSDPQGARNVNWSDLLSQIESGKLESGNYYRASEDKFTFESWQGTGWYARYDEENQKLWVYSGNKEIFSNLNDAMTEGDMGIKQQRPMSHDVSEKYRHFDLGWSGALPVYGSTMSARDAFIKGHWGWGLFHSAMAISDVFMVKSLMTSAGKVLISSVTKKTIAETGVSYGRSAATSYASHGAEFIDDGLRMVEQPLARASDLAAGWQGKGLYTGVDNWRNIALGEGKFVVGGLPGQSNYYTTLKGLNRSGLNKASLFEGLQVAKHPQFGYRGQVGIYKVTGNTPAAFGTTYANPQFGAGGLPQIFIPNYSGLQLIQTITLK